MYCIVWRRANTTEKNNTFFLLTIHLSYEQYTILLQHFLRTHLPWRCSLIIASSATEIENPLSRNELRTDIAPTTYLPTSGRSGHRLRPAASWKSIGRPLTSGGCGGGGSIQSVLAPVSCGRWASASHRMSSSFLYRPLFLPV